MIYREIAKKIKEADAVLIGASNGFSISEGLHIFAENEAFEQLFGDFKRAYGIRSILQGCFMEYPSEEIKWAFMSRLFQQYSANYSGSRNTEALKRIIGDKPYFMVTSNGENHFELAGFSAERIFEIEGSWKEMQCSRPCHDTLYPAFEKLHEMAQHEKSGLIPTELVPRCPRCGGTMQIHVALNSAFILNKEESNRLQKFISDYHQQKLVVLELGIGWRNELIKGPLMRLVAQEDYATYITVNKGEIYIPNMITEKSYGLDGDLTEVLSNIVEAMNEEE